MFESALPLVLNPRYFQTTDCFITPQRRDAIMVSGFPMPMEDMGRMVLSFCEPQCV